MNAPVSNRLPFLAAEIKREHEAVSTALKDSLRHALAAGDLLLEAKAQVAHGEWLPWLRDHCTISERTAQLYMRCAKNRPDIEAQIRNDVADLTLSQAAAVLALSSDVRRLLRFVKDLEELDDPEKIIEAAVAANIPIRVLVSPGYDPFEGRAAEEQREWHLFTLLIATDGRDIGRAAAHVEWLLQRPFQNVAEWLGEEGAKFRRTWGMRPISDAFIERWQTFLSEQAGRSSEDIQAELASLPEPRRESKKRKGRRP